MKNALVETDNVFRKIQRCSGLKDRLRVERLQLTPKSELKFIRIDVK